jgi:hypothetical protein
MSIARASVVAAVLVAVLPSLAVAQASIGGVVRDSSGAVLPGVTVDATSPALIEKTRSVVTDGTGQYKIVDLRPGTYTVTFTLAGFTTVKRDGIELTGSFAATITADLRVGSIAETITVTSETPIVDIQSAAKQRVLSEELLTAIPTGRTPLTTAILIPGMNINNQDVGGTNIINTTGGSITIHGSNGNDQRVMIDGLSTANAELAGQASNFLVNMGSTQEVAVDYSSGTADQATGGVRINMIPRDGGNLLKGSIFATGVNSSFQGNNYTQDLVDRGLRTPNGIKLNYDINPGVGGPLKRDRLWFYAAGRWTRTENYIGGMFYNLNAGNPNAWTYAPDLDNRGYVNARQRSANVRFTSQLNPRHKVSVFLDDQYRCQCANVNATTSPEAANDLKYPTQRMVTASWTSPMTNRLLLEGRFGFRNEHYQYSPTPAGDPSLKLIPVVEQGGFIPGLLYRATGLQTAGQPYQDTNGRNYEWSAAMSYVTGSHAFKAGVSDTIVLRDEAISDNDAHVTYRFNNTVPNQITQRSTPYEKAQRQPAGIGLYAQDKWTRGRLTANAGVRFDYLKTSIPAQHLGPAPLVPTRDIALAETELINWKDVTPRLAAVYDVFGNGKTALKIALNKYVVAQGVQGVYGDQLSPVNRLANFVTRSWTDTAGRGINNDYVPQCDLANPLANGECGTASDTNFGRPTLSTAIDPAVLTGWGSRPYNWEFSVGAQRELRPRVSIDVGYFRRIFGNFAVTDNRAVAPTDFTAFSVSAPVDAKLPNGGGSVINGYYDLNPNKVGVQDNFFTLASNYGEQVQHWNGVDLRVNARLRQGVLVQGGVSTGRTLTDNCAVLALVPEAAPLGVPYCRQETDFLTQVKLQSSYTVPNIDVQVSGSFQSLPGPTLAANQVVQNAVVRPSLGRDLSGGAQNVTVNLVAPGTFFGERLNQLDLRFAKVLKVGRTRASIDVDLYNAFNVSTVLTENSTYAVTSWRVPTGILTARFAKISLQLDF